MAVLEVNATRMELKRLKSRLEVARRGHSLLKNKCDGLVRQLSDLNKVVCKKRRQVDHILKQVFLNFELSKVQVASEQIHFFIESFSRKRLFVKIAKKNVMGVRLPVLKVNNLNDVVNLKNLFLQEGQFLDESFKGLFEVFPRLLNLAQLERSVEILNREIKRTRRKVNALEFLLIQNYMDTIKSIELKLEENERNNIARLSKVKIKNVF